MTIFGPTLNEEVTTRKLSALKANRASADWDDILSVSYCAILSHWFYSKQESLPSRQCTAEVLYNFTPTWKNQMKGYVSNKQCTQTLLQYL